MTELSGRTVVVTGASRGIGRAIAVALADQGASIVAVARDAVVLDRLLGELAAGAHRAVPLDVRDERAWIDLSASLTRIDGLVAAAGIYGPIGRIDAVDLSAYRETFEVNLIGSLHALRACLPGLSASSGSVVLFAGGGVGALPGYDAYVSSKAAVVRLAENLAVELAPVGVRVNAIAPGLVATDIHQATVDAGPETAGANFHAKTIQALADGGFPAGEAAALVAWLLSSKSAPLTGRLISARWDPWRDKDWLVKALNCPELLRMRRIDGELFAPTDRVDE